MGEAKTMVALIGNPVSNKGWGAVVGEQVFTMLAEAGQRHGFDVMDLTGTSFDDSLTAARENRALYDYLVVVGGDGMIALGANAVCGSGIPLGIVAVGSGNDFARGLKLPVNRVKTAVDEEGRPVNGLIDRYYAGMLNCGLDASINDRANHSRLPGGSARYAAAVLVEIARMKQYGYHVKATLSDGTVEEHDIIAPMLTVANARYIGGGLEVSPYSLLDDGMLDLVWLNCKPNVGQCAKALSNAYNGRLLASQIFNWKRVRQVEITRAHEGDEPPVLMADGEYVGHLPVTVTAQAKALRVLVPPAVAHWHDSRSEEHIMAAIERDGRDPVTGEFI